MLVKIDRDAFIDSCFVLADIEHDLNVYVQEHKDSPDWNYYMLLLQSVTKLLDEVYMPKLHSMKLHDRYTQRLLAKRGVEKR